MRAAFQEICQLDEHFGRTSIHNSPPVSTSSRRTKDETSASLDELCITIAESLEATEEERQQDRVRLELTGREEVLLGHRVLVGRRVLRLLLERVLTTVR